MSPSSTGPDFTEGTEYSLWVISDGNWSKPFVDTAIVSDSKGKLAQTRPDAFSGILDFYALTWGTSSAPSCGKTPDGIPVFEHLREEDGTIPDLRRAENMGCTAASTGGKVLLPFRHTLAKLKYMVSRQDEESLAGAKIIDIAVSGHSKGFLDVSTGEYSYTDAPDTFYPVLPEDLSSGVDVSTKMEPLADGSGLVETLVFPNASEEYLRVAVTVQTKERTFTDTYEVPAPTTDGSLRPFRFLSNHEYVLQLTVMTDKVRIVAIAPQKYDWIDEDDSSQSLGNPIVFADAIWLDRNLGANDFDISNIETFNRTVGFFYQTCRNIPYWPFCMKHKDTHYVRDTVPGIPIAEDRYEVMLSEGNTSWSSGDYRPFPVVSGKLQPYLNVNQTAGKWWVYDMNESTHLERAYTILEPEEAKNKKDGQTYSFITGGDWDNWWSRNKSQKVKTYRRGDVEYADFWDDPYDQPSPIGWKIPSMEQFMVIFPSTPFAGNWGFFNHGNSSNASNWNGVGEDARFPIDEVPVIRVCIPYYRDNGVSQKTFWETFDKDVPSYSKGWVPSADKYKEHMNSNGSTAGYRPDHGNNYKYEPEGDPSPGYHSVYIISRQDGDRLDFKPKYSTSKIDHIGTIYGIKKAGTSDAYRMRWKVKDAAAGDQSFTESPLLYVEISVYPCRPDDNLTTENFDSFDWEHPSAVMNFPISGLIDGKTGGNKYGVFCNYGAEAMYATSDVSGGKNTVLRMKAWASDNERNIYMAVVDENINHGKQIRLIRE